MLCCDETVFCFLLAFNKNLFGIIFLEHRNYLKIFNRPCDRIIDDTKVDGGKHEHMFFSVLIIPVGLFLDRKTSFHQY